MLDLLLRILSTLATLAIGIAASLLAYQQFRVSKSKLKFDLYEKRLALFKIVHDYSLDVVRYETFISFESVHKFQADTAETRFLFDDEVATYVESVAARTNIIAVMYSDLERPDTTGDQRVGIDNEIGQMKTLLSFEYRDMVDLFGKHLSIKALR